VQIENDAIPAFADIFLNGMLIDENAWLELIHENEAELKKTIERLDTFFLPVVSEKHRGNKEELDTLERQWRECTDKPQRAVYRKQYLEANRVFNKIRDEYDTYEGSAAINYSSNKQLRDTLLKMGFTKKELPSTDDRALKQLQGRPVIDALRDYRTFKKKLTTYGYAWITSGEFVDPASGKKKVGSKHPKTGRIHPRLIQLGAATGRTSCRGVNVQTIPHDEKWRYAFVARPGHKILTLDFDGCELRLLTEFSKEPAWLSAFKNGWDVHSVGAEIVFAQEWKSGAEADCVYYKSHKKCKCKVHKDLRNKVKACNFGIALEIGAAA
jgi:DNA polymerase I-like protein with 3'-5' exonuclease and polymerase domains